jgi:integrase
MTIEFRSGFASQIERFIEQKNAVGFPYNSSIPILRQFDKLCFERFVGETALTQEVVLAWAIRRETENNSTFSKRLSVIREFAKYLVRSGNAAYILPQGFAKKGTRYVPYIYSEAEIATIWAETDKIKPRKGFPTSHLVIPAIFKLLYCCGLRPVEVRKISVCDIDIGRGKLNIRESKGYKSRIVMLADDVCEMCADYHAQVSAIMPGRELFFPDSKGNLYTRDWFGKTFRIIRAKIGMPQSGKHVPRLYDFRHTFATHRLYRWMSEGKDLTAMLPYLSAYMGHTQLSNTYYYLHLVPGMLESVSGIKFTGFEELLPEVETDE